MLIGHCPFVLKARHKLIAQIYVDDIVFSVGSQSHKLSNEMKQEFKISMNGRDVNKPSSGELGLFKIRSFTLITSSSSSRAHDDF